MRFNFEKRLNRNERLSVAFSIVGAIVLLITANICAIIWLSANGGSGLETIPILDVIARIPGFVFLLLLPIGIIWLVITLIRLADLFEKKSVPQWRYPLVLLMVSLPIIFRSAATAWEVITHL